TVVTAGELHDLAAPGGAAGQADGTHRRLGPRVDQPDLLDRGDATDDLLDELDLCRGRSAKGQPAPRRLAYRIDHGRMSMAKDRRTPGTHEVDVVLAVGVVEVGALGARDETRGATNRTERADG